LIQKAKEYLKLGLTPIPLKPRAKTPLISWKKYQRERPTEKDIELWWGKWPSANIGLVTGHMSRLTVLDCDSEEAYQEAKRRGLPECPIDLYFAFSGETNFQKRDNLSETDLRGEGGYVVAPPSIHPSGKPYEWILPFQSVDKLNLLPKWVTANGKAKKEHFERLIFGVPEGERNNALTQLVGKWASNGYDYETCLNKAKEWNSTLSIPLDEKEVTRTVTSIYERHAGQVDELFNHNPKDINPHNVARKIWREHKLINAGDKYYSYQKGAYRTVEDEEIKKIILKLLGNTVTRHKVNEIIFMLKAMSSIRVSELNNTDFINGAFRQSPSFSLLIGFLTIAIKYRKT